MRQAGLLSQVPLSTQSAQKEYSWMTLPGRVSGLYHPLAVPSLHLLGGFRLTCGETPVTGIDTPRLQSLLSYLALHHGVPQSRTKLAALFWPDSTEAQAHTNLRNLLHKVRSALPSADRWLVIDRHILLWQGGDSWRLDVLDFERAVAHAEQAEQKEDDSALRLALEQVVELYRGELLPTCYDEWVLPERERLSQVFLGTLERLLCLRGRAGDYSGAIALAQRLVQEDPLHEAGYRHLMRLYAASGNRAAALRTYRACTRLLDRELGVGPSLMTRQVYEQLVEAKQLTSFTVMKRAGNRLEAPLAR